jgi:hypothetical protein
MGGVYGSIDSRADFVAMLAKARELARALLARGAQNGVLQAIDAQLGALQAWTAGGGEPTVDQRRTITMGVLVVRELDGVLDPEVQALVAHIHPLSNYVEDWPTDEQAASATEAAFWRRFGLSGAPQ